MRLRFLLLMSYTLLLFGCENEQTQSKEVICVQYPNGGSELAWLMRNASDRMEEQKETILKGKSIKLMPLDVNHILSAVPTESGKNTSELYKTMANRFLSHTNKLDSIPLEGQIKYYNQTVAQCVNCHETQCPGPLVRIKKLYIED
ncbi:hypothetical protein [Flammeovirga kamogawensis]|uniref:Cytochrome c domain-containing protein n=1 Tax=Flammeovirga kamogawensis TaxID=373891 RepID=A0ABX8GZS4_9BACT|nr:hypothetical protein [Flammeovirga kamogawensis]MBB6459292.1 hypothetical protein [Flammeovirga kamogawensis]QWG08852.1 hypothetical protein KM029_07895 [Flammeovirga kamogawensis]TRX67142.1 hypothetical protein EO216_02940 [Flammeovirga kamogawensis]